MARLPSSTTNWPAIWKPKDDFGNSLGFVGEGRVLIIKPSFSIFRESEICGMQLGESKNALKKNRLSQLSSRYKKRNKN
jgi:hypothetical protein